MAALPPKSSRKKQETTDDKETKLYHTAFAHFLSLLHVGHKQQPYANNDKATDEDLRT